MGSSGETMSVLSFLPRLTAWGSSQKGRTLQPLVQEETTNYGSNSNIDITRAETKKKKKKARRKRISYWSDEEAVAIKPSRYPTANTHTGDDKAKQFRTTWRPQTTFGYKNHFTHGKYQGVSSSPYMYQSNPHIVRTRKITSGVRLKPIERVETPYLPIKTKKKLKKRKHRNRSQTT